MALQKPFFIYYTVGSCNELKNCVCVTGDGRDRAGAPCRGGRQQLQDVRADVRHRLQGCLAAAHSRRILGTPGCKLQKKSCLL
jgi:hypothetical protein